MDELECFCFFPFFQSVHFKKFLIFPRKHFYAVASASPSFCSSSPVGSVFMVSPSPFALSAFFKAKYACLMAYFLAVHFPFAVPVPTTFPSMTHSTLHSGYSPDSLYP